MSEINTCPICGGSAHFSYAAPMNNGQRPAQVRCAVGCVEQIIFYMNEEDAAKAWNFRQSPSVGKSLTASVADSLRRFLSDGQKVIWREPFRWHDDNGVLSNHYDGMSLAVMADAFDYDVIVNCECAAIIQRRQAESA
jgi:hypothetical protein